MTSYRAIVVASNNEDKINSFNALVTKIDSTFDYFVGGLTVIIKFSDDENVFWVVRISNRLVTPTIKIALKEIANEFNLKASITWTECKETEFIGD